MTRGVARPSLGLAALLAAPVLIPVTPASAVPAAPSPARDRVALADAGYGDTELRGLYASADLFLPLPRGARATGTALLTLVLDRSPLLRPRSSLTVLANGVPLTSAALTRLPVSGARLTVPVPASRFGDEGLSLSLRGYLRVTDDECEDSSIPAQWVTVRRDSSVAVTSGPVTPDLSDLPGRLLGGPGTTARRVAVTVPATTDADGIAATGSLAAQVGRWAAQRQTDVVLVDAGADASAEVPQLVLAQGKGSQPALLATTSGAQLAAPDGGSLRSGAEALLDGRKTPVLAGTSVVLDGTAPKVPANATPWRESAASFAQLGIGEREVTGEGRHDVVVGIDRPAGWRLKKEVALELDVDASAQVQPDGSSLQVVAAGTDIGTKQLRPGRHRYRFDVPDGLLDRGLDGAPIRSFDLEARIVTDAPTDRCRSNDPAASRVTVLSTSRVLLPHGDAGSRDLGRFPVVPGDRGRLVVVLPKDPDAQTVLAGAQLCAAIGRWQTPGGDAPLLTTADALPKRDRDEDLVLLGRADSDLGKEVVVKQEVAPGSALLALVDSPLDEKRTALLVRAAPGDLLAAAQALTSRTTVRALHGQRALLSGLVPATTTATAGADAPPALSPVLDESLKDKPWALPALVLLVALLVVIVLVARHRWGRAR